MDMNDKEIIDYENWWFEQAVLREIKRLEPKTEKERLGIRSRIKLEFTERKI